MLLRRMGSGDDGAREALFRIVYPELQVMARSALHSGGFHRLGMNATAVVNAACAKWLTHQQLNVEDRRPFFFFLSRAMHDVLVEEARHDLCEKRGGGRRRMELHDTIEGEVPETWDVIDLHEALTEFRAVDPEGCEIVELRFFACRTLEETCDVTGKSLAVVRRHLSYAMAWLRERLAEPGPADRA